MMSSYNFRIRINLPVTLSIQSEEKTIELQHPDPGIQLTLSANDAKELKNAHQLMIKGGVYNTEEIAREAGRICQHALRLTFAKIRIGADFGDELKPKSVITKDGLKMLEQQFEQRVLNDVHGVMVYDADIPTRFVRSDISIKIGEPLERIIQLLSLALKQVREFSDKELLAFELFDASFFEQSERSRFLTLMIAIEALLEPKDRNPEAIKHVQLLMKATRNCSDLSSTEQDSLIGSLEWLLKESISKTGREFMSQCLGQRLYNDVFPDKFFTYCYKLRSQIVHTGRSSSSDFGKITAELERLVSDILCGCYFDLDVSD